MDEEGKGCARHGINGLVVRFGVPPHGLQVMRHSCRLTCASDMNVALLVPGLLNDNIPQNFLGMLFPIYYYFRTNYFLIIVNNILNFVAAFNACGSLAGMMIASPLFK